MSALFISQAFLIFASRPLDNVTSVDLSHKQLMHAHMEDTRKDGREEREGTDGGSRSDQRDRA